jgi:myosin heavy subunit
LKFQAEEEAQKAQEAHEKARLEYHTMLEKNENFQHDIKRKHELELTRLREEHSTRVEDIRNEREREREEATARVDREVSQVTKLQHQMDTYRTRSDSLLKEVETAKLEAESAKVELQFKVEAHDEMKAHQHVLEDEIKRLRNDHIHLSELKESLRRETNEKEMLKERLEQEKLDVEHKLNHIQEMYDAIRMQFNESEHKFARAEAELATIKASHSTVETISRDNEKYKNDNQVLQNDLMSANHSISDLKRDISKEQDSLRDALHQIDIKKTEIVHLEKENEALKIGKEEINEILVSDRSKLESLDKILDELKQQTSQEKKDHVEHISTLEHALEANKDKMLELEKSKVIVDAHLETIRTEYATGCTGMAEHLNTWDASLSDYLDGLQDYLPLEARTNTSASPYQQSGGYLNSNTPFTPMARAFGASPFASTQRMNKNDPDNIDEAHTFLIPTMNSYSERVSMKVNRLHKIKTLFEAGMKKEMGKVEKFYENVNQKKILLEHRITEANSQLERLRIFFDRDRKKAEDEEAQAVQFRTNTLEAHASELHRMEDKYRSLTVALTQEQDNHKFTVESFENKLERKESEIEEWKGRLANRIEEEKQNVNNLIESERAVQEDIRRELGSIIEDCKEKLQTKELLLKDKDGEIKTLHMEVDVCKNSIQDLQSDLEGFSQAESVLNQLNNRCEDIAASKEALGLEMTQEIRNRDNDIHELHKVCEDLREEVNRLQEEKLEMSNDKVSYLVKETALVEQHRAQMIRLQDLVTQLENSLKQSDGRISELSTEIDRLSKRQITPELLNIIQDTRRIMLTTVSDHQDVLQEKDTFLHMTANLLEKEGVKVSSQDTVRSMNMNAMNAMNSSNTPSMPMPISIQTNDNINTTSLIETTQVHGSPTHVRSNQDVNYSEMAKNINLEDAGLRSGISDSHSVGGEDAQKQAANMSVQSQSPMNPMHKSAHAIPNISSTSAYRGSVRGTTSGSVNSMGNQILSSYTNTSRNLGLNSASRGNNSTPQNMYSDGSHITLRSPMAFSKTTPVNRDAHVRFSNSNNSFGHSYHNQGNPNMQFAPQMSPAQQSQGQFGSMLDRVEYSNDNVFGFGNSGNHGNNMFTSPRQMQAQRSNTYSGNRGTPSGILRHTDQVYLPPDPSTNTITATPDGKKGFNFNFSSQGRNSNNPTTPGTSARQSVNRLQRLGSDIKQLADKLDSFNATDTMKYQWGSN